MAGLQADAGDKTHRLYCGTIPTVGMRVFTNDWKWAVITKLDERNMILDNCGWYCEAWASVQFDDGGTAILNCDRMTTRRPR